MHSVPLRLANVASAHTATIQLVLLLIDAPCHPACRFRTCRYDVTEYVDEHPGGESILAHVGTDATEGVYGPQHPITTFLLMEEYCIGKLAAGEEAAFQKSK